MAGKGSNRRPCQISQKEMNRNWKRAFRKMKKETAEFVNKIEEAHKQADK